MLELVFYFFLITTSIQILFYLANLLIVVFHNPMKKRLGAKDLPPVSVIIAVRNELDNLKNLLPQLLNQKYAQYEIIIVDDRSEDETYDYLLQESNKSEVLKHVRVNITPDHVNPKKYALTLGIKAASYDQVLFTDGDCLVNSQYWIQSMACKMTDDHQFVLGYSPYKRSKSLIGAFIRYETIMTAIQYLAAALTYMPYMGVGRNMMYRKSFFLQNKGFYPYTSVLGGDDDLYVNQHAKGKNTTVAWGKNTLVYSVPKKFWSSYFRQKKRHLFVSKYYSFNDKLKLGLRSSSHVFSWFCFIALIAFNYMLDYVLVAFGFRMLLIIVSLLVASYKFGDRFTHWLAPVFDFFLVIYYIFIGLPALFAKKVRWN